MDNQQKGTILILLKMDEMSRNYANNYWFSYKDFLDPTDDFTDFCCERLDGKQGYITLIENLLNIDSTAKIFVQVYGLEENNHEQFITADTLIIFSKLSLYEYYGAAEPPVRCGESHLSGLTEPPIDSYSA